MKELVSIALIGIVCTIAYVANHTVNPVTVDDIPAAKIQHKKK